MVSFNCFEDWILKLTGAVCTCCSAICIQCINTEILGSKVRSTPHWGLLKAKGEQPTWLPTLGTRALEMQLFFQFVAPSSVMFTHWWKKVFSLKSRINHHGVTFFLNEYIILQTLPRNASSHLRNTNNGYHYIFFSFLNSPPKLTIRIKPQHRHLVDIVYYWKQFRWRNS